MTNGQHQYFLFWSGPGCSGSAVWFLLCVYDFGCVGRVFVSGQQQGPSFERDREVNQSIARGLQSGFVDYSVLMVCVIWTESLEAHEMQPGPLGGGGYITRGSVMDS